MKDRKNLTIVLGIEGMKLKTRMTEKFKLNVMGTLPLCRVIRCKYTLEPICVLPLYFLPDFGNPLLISFNTNKNICVQVSVFRGIHVLLCKVKVTVPQNIYL